MADYLLITRADGGLSILRLLDDADPAAELAKWQSAAQASWLPVASSRLAADPAFPDRADRDAWVDDGTAVTVDAGRKATLAAALLASLRAEAKAWLDDRRDALLKLLRAEALVMLDEVNLLRARLRAQDAAVAAATSLDNLKTRWAALAAAAPVPDRTAAQLKAAIKARVDTPDAD